MRFVTYIVQYTDPNRSYEGNVKTRHFDSEEEAWRHAEWLSTYQEDVYNISITEQISIITRKKLN